MRTIKVVGLTGQTGAGKSSVSRLIRSQNIASIDCDEVSRYVVDNEKKCLADLALEFGITILYADGTLNRRRLGAAVFGDHHKLAKLNALIFPYIRAEINHRIDDLQEQGVGLVMLDAPTLFEAGADADCDYIVSVIAPESERLNRIVVRDHLTDDQARKRIASQHDDAYYTERSQFVLQNEGSPAELHVKTLELL
ncbi:MAG: dephospho-CoA kinase, partial [Oscillospiraceae bacterium]